MNSAKYAFYYMLSLVTLFIMSLSFGSILFEIIEKFFPDITRGIYYYNSSPLKMAISGILIATPIFYFIMHKIYASLKSGELKAEAEIRKWLTYFILFISSVVVIGSLISILNNFLDGALTINFVLKALTVLFIASLVFGFYFYDIRRKEFKDQKLNKIFYITTLAIVLIGLVSAFLIVESPTETRNRKIDQNILQDFNNIKYSIDNYYNKYQKMPQDLIDVQEDFNIINPQTNEKYTYNVIVGTRYRLCTEFLSSNLEKKYNYYDGTWKHDKGYQCIEKEANLEEVKQVIY
ncbi:MAG: DUF5671 domain-containing protein [Candidatus Pacebacteria bacterium]|nr:DUF5671 domain-containing protein [Candidatus Paceibacterota bacterium]